MDGGGTARPYRFHFADAAPAGLLVLLSHRVPLSGKGWSFPPSPLPPPAGGSDSPGEESARWSSRRRRRRLPRSGCGSRSSSRRAFPAWPPIGSAGQVGVRIATHEAPVPSGEVFGVRPAGPGARSVSRPAAPGLPHAPAGWVTVLAVREGDRRRRLPAHRRPGPGRGPDTGRGSARPRPGQR